MDLEELMPRSLEIVGRWGKDVAGNDLSLEKYKGTDCLEGFYPATKFIDFLCDGPLSRLLKGKIKELG